MRLLVQRLQWRCHVVVGIHDTDGVCRLRGRRYNGGRRPALPAGGCGGGCAGHAVGWRAPGVCGTSPPHCGTGAGAGLTGPHPSRGPPHALVARPGGHIPTRVRVWPATSGERSPLADPPAIARHWLPAILPSVPGGVRQSMDGAGRRGYLAAVTAGGNLALEAGGSSRQKQLKITAEGGR